MLLFNKISYGVEKNLSLYLHFRSVLQWSTIGYYFLIPRSIGSTVVPFNKFNFVKCGYSGNLEVLLTHLILSRLSDETEFSTLLVLGFSLLTNGPE